MRGKTLTLAVAAVLLVVFSGRCLALDSSSLWPKILKILEKVEELEQQNKEILQNQRRILGELEGLRGAIDREPEPPPSGGERPSAP